MSSSQHPDESESLPPRHETWPCAIALAALLAVGGVAAWANRAQINPDGICYIQLATYLASGQVEASVSGYWSPLFIWCLAPLIALGLDGQLASRLVLLLWSAFGVVVADRLAVRLRLPASMRAFALLAITLRLIGLSISVTTPDILVGACLLAYISALSHDDVFTSRWRAAVAGGCGGLAFLSKSYALPFTLLHLPSILILRRRLEPRERRPSLHAVAAAIAWGLAGLFAIAAPWIVALSARYDRPTWSTVGPIARAASGPHVRPGDVQHPFHDFVMPVPPHRSAWETPEVLPYPPTWSPMDSLASAIHQYRVVRANTEMAKKFIADWDLTGFALPLLVFVPLIVGAAWYEGHDVLPKHLMDAWAWVPITFLVYVSGYLVVYVENRYLEPFLLPLAATLFVGTVSGLRVTGTCTDAGRYRRWRMALAIVMCASIAAGATRTVLSRIVHGFASVRSTEELTRRLRSLAGDGHVALVFPATSPDLGAWPIGQRLAFYLDQTFVGPHEVGPALVPRLDEFGVRTVLALRQGDSPTNLGVDWTLRGTIESPHAHESAHLDVLVRR